MPYDRSFEQRATPLDPWGLPPSSSASRRDSEEMLSRISRTETESSDSWRRIDEHLRTVARRLDSAERRQSENDRAMNKTATEINIATREQARAFDQLGGHVMNIGDRLERLERNASQDGLKDAVKALHQGLSRLADQITQTASQSAQQVSTMSGGMEQLANRLGQVRSDSEAATRRTDARVAAMEEENRTRFAAFEAETARTLDQRLAAVEKASHFNTNALDHALERLESQAGVRAGDQAELQKRHAETDGAISRLEESLDALEARNAGEQAELQKRHAETDGAISRLEESLEALDTRSANTTLERRLDSIERALGSLVSRLETHDPTAGLEDSMRTIARRVETVEKKHGELLDELRANLASGGKPAISAPEPAYDPSIFAQKEFAPPPDNFEAPPFAETPPPVDGEPAMHDQDAFAADAFSTGAFAPPPSEESADPAAGDNFLAAARRSARAAAETDANRSGRLAFTWGAQAAAEGEPVQGKRYLVPAIIAAILIVALAGGIVISQKLRPGHPQAVAAAPHAVPNNAPFTPAPENLPAPSNSQALNQPLQPPAPAGTTPANPAPTQAKSAPVQPAQPQTPAQNKGPVPTLDRVMQLANGGNAVAQTIIGLKELDGDGVPANAADAAKWLERAAEQGQAVAQYRLGAVYERGQGVTANPATATHWYQLAANQGNRKAMHNLAVAFASGAAGKKDMAEAARWFAKAAALGLADSQFNLAVQYERGDGVSQSLLDAYKWYAIAAGQGDAESKSRLTVLGTQLSDDDRNAAQKSAASFHAGALNRAANVPPEMADLSGG